MTYLPPNGLGKLLSSTLDAKSIIDASNQRLQAQMLETSRAVEAMESAATRSVTESWWKKATEGTTLARTAATMFPVLALQHQTMVNAGRLTPEESLAATQDRYDRSAAALTERLREAAPILGPNAVLEILKEGGVSLDKGISEVFDELLKTPPADTSALQAELDQLRTNPPPGMMGAQIISRQQTLEAEIAAAQAGGATPEGQAQRDMIGKALEDYKDKKAALDGLAPRVAFDWVTSQVLDIERAIAEIGVGIPKSADVVVSLVMELHRVKNDILTGKGASVPDIRQSHFPALESLIEGIDEAIEIMIPTDEARAKDFANQLSHATGSMIGLLAVRAAGLPVSVAGAAVQGVAGYEDARARDAKAGQVLLSFLLNAGLGTSEAIPIDRFFRAVGGDIGEDVLIQMLVDTTASSAEEFLQEFGQSIGEDVIAKYGLMGALGEWSDGYDPERDISLSEALKQGGIGAIIGGGTSITMGALQLKEGGANTATPDMTPEEMADVVEQVWREGLLQLDEIIAPDTSEGPQPLIIDEGSRVDLQRPDPAKPGFLERAGLFQRYAGAQPDPDEPGTSIETEEAADPGTLSAQIATAIEPDITSYGENEFDPLIVNEADAQKHLRAQVAADEVRRGERNAGNRWTPQERVVLAPPEGSNLPPVAIGDITFDDWITKVDGLATDEEVQKWGNWYAETTDTVAARLDVSQPMAGRIVAAFLVANQQSSPSGSFLETIVQAEEIAKNAGDKDIRSAGLKKVALAVRKILRGEAIDRQFSVKIADFYDSATGSPTRRWVGNDPAGGAPFVIDRHSARDLGATSDAYLKMLAARGYKIPEGVRIDVGQQKDKKGRMVEGSISDGIYNNRSSFGRDLTAHLNEIGWHGRSDWTPAQVQAIGWMATLRLTGQRAEDMNAAIDRNEAEIAVTAVPSAATPWGAEWGARLQALPAAAQRSITARIAGKARKIAFRYSRALASSPVYVGSGGWENAVNQSAITRVVASAESMRETALMLGFLLDQNAVFASRVTPFTESAKTVAIDLIFRQGMSRNATLDAFAAMQASGVVGKTKESVFSGFMPMIHPDGREGIRLVAGETQTQVRKINKWISDGGFADALGPASSELDIFISNAEVISVENDWAKGSSDYARDLHDLSGPDIVADLVRARGQLHADLEAEIQLAEGALADEAVDGRGTEGGRDPRGETGYSSLVRDLGGAEGLPQPVDGPTFDAAMQAAAPGLGPLAAQVSRVLPDREGVQRFLLDDGKTGFALEGDNIIGVFSTPGVAPGAAQRVLRAAVAMGGRRLDGFNTFLPHVYAKGGFRAVAKLGFDPAYAPKAADDALADWDADGMRAARTPGRGAEDWGAPEVVFMVYDPENASAETDNVVPDYDAGVAAQDAALAELDRFSAQRARVVPGENDEGQFALNFIGDPTSDRFGAWFGSSQVVDENGDPLIVYHGTSANFSRFMQEANDGRDPGFWFSDRVEVSSSYGRSARIARDPEVAKVIRTGLPFTLGREQSRVVHLRDLSDEAFAALRSAHEGTAWALDEVGIDLLEQQREESVEGVEDWLLLQQKGADGVWETVKWPISGSGLAEHENNAQQLIGREFANLRGQRASMEGSIMPAYLRIQNPLVIDYEGEAWNDPPSSATEPFERSGGFYLNAPLIPVSALARVNPEILRIIERARNTSSFNPDTAYPGHYNFERADDASALFNAVYDAIEMVYNQRNDWIRERILEVKPAFIEAARARARASAQAVKAIAIADGTPIAPDFDEKAEALAEKRAREAEAWFTDRMDYEDLYDMAFITEGFSKHDDMVLAAEPEYAYLLVAALYDGASLVARMGGGPVSWDEFFGNYGGSTAEAGRLISIALREPGWKPTRDTIMHVSLGMDFADPGQIPRRPDIRLPIAIDRKEAMAFHDYGVHEGRKWRPSRTRHFVNIAEEQGYDGVIFKNIIDTADGRPNKSNVYVVLDGAQAKSAVANTGEYSESDQFYAAVGTSTTREPYVGEATRPDAGIPADRGASPWAAPGKPAAEPVALADIGDRFQKLMGLITKQGRFTLRGKEIMGQYDRKSGAVRLRTIDDVSTMFHEAGHDLHARQDGALNPMIKANDAEIEKAARELYEGDLTNADKATRIREGFAELFRLYVGNRAEAARRAPGWTRDMDAFLQREAPEVYRGLGVIGAMVGAWAGQSSVSSMRSKIVSGKPEPWVDATIAEFKEKGFPATVGRYMRDMVKHGFDRAIPLRELEARLLRAAARNGKLIELNVADDPAKRFDMMRNSGAAAMMNFYHGVEGYRSNERISRGLQEALFISQGVSPDEKTIGKIDADRQLNFATYLVARAALAEIELGKLKRLPTGDTPGDVQQTIKDMEDRYGDSFTLAADIVNEYGRALWQKRYDAGLLSKEVYEEGLKRTFYVPLQRDMSDRGGKVGQAIQQAAGSTGMPLVHVRHGSDRRVIDPMVSLMVQTFATETAIAQNDVKLLLAQLVDQTGQGSGNIAQRVPAHDIRMEKVSLRDVARQLTGIEAMTEAEAADILALIQPYMEQDAYIKSYTQTATSKRGEPLTFFWEGGKLKAMQIIDAELARDVIQLIDVIGPQSMNDMVMTTLAAGQVMVRQAITRWPDFIIRNFIRDQLQAWISTDVGYVPFVSGLKGGIDEVMGKEASILYNAKGGLFGGVGVAQLEGAKYNRDIAALKGKGYRARMFARGKLSGLLHVTEISETATRLGIMDKAYQRALKEGLTEYQAAMEAAYMATDYMNYGLHGQTTGVVRRLVPFMNAQLVGLHKMERVLFATEVARRVGRANALKFVVQSFVKSTNGMPLTRQERMAVDLGRKAWIKMSILAACGGILAALFHDDEDWQNRGEYLAETHWYIPIGNGKAITIPKPFEWALLANAVERGIEAMAGDKMAMERFRRGAIRQTMPVLDNPILTAWNEQQANYSFFRGSELIPSWIRADAEYDPSRAVTPYTSQLAKDIGAVTGWKPILVDHWKDALLATAGRDISTIYEQVRNGNAGSLTAYDMPILRASVRSTSRGSVVAQDFWDLMGQTDGRYTGAAGAYGSWLAEANPRVTAQKVADMPPEERYFAFLNEHFEAKHKRLHPLRRAQDFSRVASAIRREMISPFGVADTGGFSDKGVFQLTPKQKSLLAAELTSLAMREQRNAMIMLGEPGWDDKQMADTAGSLEVIRAISPEIADELDRRLKKAKVYPREAVEELWPEARERLATDGPEAYLDDLSGWAETW